LGKVEITAWFILSTVKPQQLDLKIMAAESLRVYYTLQDMNKEQEKYKSN
jgi:hypothetical protein